MQSKQKKEILSKIEEYSMGDFFIQLWSKTFLSSLAAKEHPTDCLSNMVKNRGEELKILHTFFTEKYKKEHFVFLEQVHGSDCLFIGEDFQRQDNIFWGRADAAFSDRKDVVLSVRASDCIPIAFSSEDPFVFGVIHAGWRGLQKNIVENTLESIWEKVDFKDHNSLRFWIGPHIHQDSYVVGKDVFTLFDAKYSKDTDQTQKRLLSLKQILKDRLLALGINDLQIYWHGKDTFTTKNLYSNRKGDIGRNVVCILLKEKDIKP